MIFKGPRNCRGLLHFLYPDTCNFWQTDRWEMGGQGMKRLSGVVGVQQGSRILFSDFAQDGPMWTGSGPREVRQWQDFGEPFLAIPAVMVGVSMWDIDHQVHSRVDISADNVTDKGFEIVFRTWSDSRIARIRADWMAIGTTRGEDEWEVV